MCNVFTFFNFSWLKCGTEKSPLCINFVWYFMFKNTNFLSVFQVRDWKMPHISIIKNTYTFNFMNDEIWIFFHKCIDVCFLYFVSKIQSVLLIIFCLCSNCDISEYKILFSPFKRLSTYLYYFFSKTFMSCKSNIPSVELICSFSSFTRRILMI